MLRSDGNRARSASRSISASIASNELSAAGADAACPSIQPAPGHRSREGGPPAGKRGVTSSVPRPDAPAVARASLAMRP